MASEKAVFCPEGLGILAYCVALDEVLRLCARESLQLCPPSAVNWGEKSLFLRTIDYCYY